MRAHLIALELTEWNADHIPASVVGQGLQGQLGDTIQKWMNV